MRWVPASFAALLAGVVMLPICSLVSLRAQETSEAVQSAFLQANLDPVIATEKYQILIDKVWPEQAAPLSFFAVNAPDVVALALPKLRNQAHTLAVRALMNGPQTSPVIMDALLNQLQTCAISLSRDAGYFGWEEGAGVQMTREGVANAIERKSKVPLAGLALDNPVEIDRYIQKVRNVVAPDENSAVNASGKKSDPAFIAQYLQSPKLRDKVDSLNLLANGKDKRSIPYILAFIQDLVAPSESVTHNLERKFLLIRSIHTLEEVRGEVYLTKSLIRNEDFQSFFNDLDPSGKLMTTGGRQW